MKNENNIPQIASTDVLTVDLKKFLYKMLSFWWLFAICMIIAGSMGYFYLRYATFQYSTRAVLLIKDAGKSGTISESSILNEGLTGGAKSMDNEIQILNSLSLMEKVADRLGLRVSYFRLGNVKETELYDRTCFIVDSFYLKPNIRFGTNLFVELNDYESFLVKDNEDAETGVRKYFGVPFETDAGTFLIRLSPTEPIVKGNYRLNVSPLQSAASRIRSGLSVERIGDPRSSSVLELSMLDPVPKKAMDVVNTLIEVYNEEEVKDENKVLRNTLEFIDNRVVYLINELDSVEGGIQRFKSANEIITSDASSSMNYTLGEIRTSINKMSQFEIQKNILSSLETFLNQPSENFQLIPANLIAESPVLSGYVNQYNQLVIRNNMLSETATKENPARVALESQLLELRNLIKETIINIKTDLQIPIAEIEKNIQDLRRSMGSIPGLEKRLIEQMRTQSVKENLFLYLLQKREETALSEAVATAKTRVVDRARLPVGPVYPQRRLIYVVSALLGFLVPLFMLILHSLLDNKVNSEDTIRNLTEIPLLGSIPLNKGSEAIIVKKGSRSAINEMFRLLRTNLNFIFNKKGCKSMLVTSSISGEGKTFVAINLGIALSLSSKKVILIGLDLRKPKLGKYLGKEGSIGVTNYLVNQKSLDEVIQHFPDNQYLDFISAGPPPPNPSELILGERMQELLSELKERYDYILIDTPPIGLVSDALLLRSLIDQILVVVRQKFTRKIMIRNLQNMFSKGELKKANIIFNGVRKGSSYYGYGGGSYGYGYHQDYYIEDDEK